MAKLTVEDVLGVEIMRTGSWTGSKGKKPVTVTYTEDDFDDIVEAFNETRAVLPPRLQLGHDLKQRYARKLFGDDHEGADGFPALGYPVRLWREGDRLMADFSHVPTDLVDLVRSGSYAERSVGIGENVPVNGRTYRLVLDHVALLGDDPPAVKGMAPIELSDAMRATGAVLVTLSGTPVAFAAVHDDGRPMTPEEIAAASDTLRSLFQQAGDLLSRLARGRRGVEGARNHLRSLREEFDRIHLTGASPVTTPTDQTILADPEAPMAAGGGTNIVSADVLAAMLAVLTNKSPDDYSGIFGAVKSALGAAPAESGDADPLAGDGATLADGGTVIPELKPDAVDPQTLAVFTAMRDELTALKGAHLTDRAKLAAFEVKQKRDAAEAKADAVISARALPATVRDALVAFAEAGRDDLFAQVADAARVVPVSERGTSEGAPAPVVTLSEGDRAIMRVTGLTEAQMIAQKARDAGITLPDVAAA